MKTLPALLAPQYSSAGSTLCQCLKMTLRDGTIVGATSIDKVLFVGADTYQPWLQVSDLVSTATLGVDNLELTVVTDDVSLMSDLEAGRYDNASFYLFETNYLSPTDGVNGLKRGTTGEAKITDTGRYVIEFRGLTQALQQTVGIVTSRTCRANFADFPSAALSATCGLTAATYTIASTVTSVTSRQSVTDSALAGEAADLYGAGFLTFTSGLNSGYRRQLKSSLAGVRTFTLPFPFDIAPSDAYSLIRGCRKRLTEDCKTKFGNVVNFQGEPHLPGVDLLTKVPGVGT